MIPENFIKPFWKRLGFTSKEDMERYAYSHGSAGLDIAADLVAIEARLEIVEEKLDRLIDLCTKFQPTV